MPQIVRSDRGERVIVALAARHRRSEDPRPLFGGLHVQRQRAVSIAIEFDQPLVADPEVMRDLVEHDVPDLAA